MTSTPEDPTFTTPNHHPFRFVFLINTTYRLFKKDKPDGGFTRRTRKTHPIFSVSLQVSPAVADTQTADPHVIELGQAAQVSPDHIYSLNFKVTHTDCQWSNVIKGRTCWRHMNMNSFGLIMDKHRKVSSLGRSMVSNGQWTQFNVI